jgi:hypothetical protein
VPSHHTQFSVDFTTYIAESNFRYTQAAFSTDSDAVSTVCADCFVSVMASATSLNTVTIILAPSAALATFCEIWPVAAVCCCTDAGAFMVSCSKRRTMVYHLFNSEIRAVRSSICVNGLCKTVTSR